MKRLHLIATTALIFVAGCATAPVKTDFEHSRVYNEGFDTVWTQTVQFFATNNIPIKTIAKDSGVIYAERLSFDVGDADCGSHPMTQPLNSSVSLNVFVQKLADMRTQVSINATYHQTLGDLYRNPVGDVACESRGKIEETILNSIH
ncbi:MAG: hypothetical protein KGJ49_12970 [Alphaproteobacteria bacterium]|nr:hypothetical protein [Alphaproteobacteria bacterium]